MKGKYRIIRRMDMGDICGKVALIIKDNLKMINSMELGLKFIKMAGNCMENLLMINL